MENQAYSARGAAIVRKMMMVVSDPEHASSILKRIQSYAPLWKLAQVDGVLESFIDSMRKGQDYWWRPANASLIALSQLSTDHDLDSLRRQLLQNGSSFLNQGAVLVAAQFWQGDKDVECS